MRYLRFILILLVISPIIYAAETSVGLDRCVVLNDQTNQSAESAVAMHFNLPNSVTDKEILYAEINFSFTFQTPHQGSLYEFMMFPALEEWSEETIDYEEAEDIADSLMTGAYTIRLANQNEFHIDITNFVFDIVEGERTNYGLIVLADLLGDNNLRLPGNLGGIIRNVASVRIVYK